MSGYYFDDKKRFIIKDYHKAKTFSSFLPGIAGTDGIPIWAFYVNRGQGICSFGIENKKNPIMEFTPANGAYQTVSSTGFRTFIKDVDKGHVCEPFGTSDSHCSRKMAIEKDGFSLEETNEQEGLTVAVRYTTLSNVPFGGLVRQTAITNDSDAVKHLQIVDGMPALLPYGIDNEAYKAMSNLMQSWMEVSQIESKVPFYKLRSSTEDVAVVSEINSGYFYMSEALMDDSVLNIYDAKMIFDYQLDLRIAVGFENRSMEEMTDYKQVYANKVPSAFQLAERTLEPGSTVVINSVVGYAQDYEGIDHFVSGLVLKDFVDEQFVAAKSEIDEICQDVETHTGIPLFDEYIKQSYLDNVLRGGRPHLFEAEHGQHIYHVFSRKHGDLERDYNFFSLEPSKYSQGNGNYRDVNQNRRSDVIINPEVKDFNVWMFYNLVQADGYNPLSIQGTVFCIKEENKDKLLKALSGLALNQEQYQGIETIIQLNFTPGKLMNGLELLNVENQKVFDLLIKYATQEIDAVFGEGFWSDHFTYNLDLIDSYLYIYPDQLETLLFGRKDYKFFNAPYEVLPRDKKYGLSEEGQVRQYEAIIKKSSYEGQWLKDKDGRLIETDLFNKLLVLILTKFMNLDAFGMGLEMEGERPGWNDALNGLPGLFGSGMSETIELKRCVDFLVSAVDEVMSDGAITAVLESTAKLMGLVNEVTIDSKSDFERWDRLNVIKEAYRMEVSSEISSDEIQVSKEEIDVLLLDIGNVLSSGIKRASAFNCGRLPSYFVNEVTDYECLDTKSHYGLTGVRVKGFSHRTLPMFLEAPARYLKTLEVEKAGTLHATIKASGIYDTGLGMYKTSASLEKETLEIGRIRAFTAGWLERESVFLHMTYKYLLSLLSAGLYESYFEAIKTNMVPFLDPEVYGRPTTENSSFIASSVNPNPEVVGQGFVARLSGSTAEMISMWVKMFIGSDGFKMKDGVLIFTFKPILTSQFFDEDGKASFTLFSKTKVTYINETRKNTFGTDGCSVDKIVVDGTSEGTTYLATASSERLRNGLINEIVVYLK